MPIEITVPRLGWSMEEGIFAEWLIREGEWVSKGDMLFTLEGEKAAQDIESFDEGILRLQAESPTPGATVRVGQTIGILLTRAEAEQAAPAGAPAVAPANRPVVKEAAAVAKTIEPIVRQEPEKTVAQMSGAVTPRARRAARELGVAVAGISGSGRNGRIRERDILAASGTRPAAVSTAPKRGGLRQTIAQKLQASFHACAPVTLMLRCDAGNLVSLRQQFKTASQGGSVPTLTDLIVKLTARAIERHPEINGRWTGSATELLAEIHLGLAVDVPGGLMVPVLRDVPALSVRQIAAATKDLAARARAGTLSLAQSQGGTFTITNLGMFGIEMFTPILNAPEIAILGVGAICREAVVQPDDRIAPGDVLPLSLTFDHRAIDGAPAARFLQTLRSAIEAPAAWLVE